MSWIQTYNGGRFDFFNMSKEKLDINAIAHALSQVCRFGGHCREFYSVAQHSVYVSQLCKPDNRMAGLMHDATEAYIGDMVSPLKKLVPEFQNYESDLWRVVASQFGIPKKLPDDVKAADLAMLSAEARDLCGADPTTWGLKPARADIPTIAPWSCKLAKKYFLEEFHRLSGEYARALATSSFGGVY